MVKRQREDWGTKRKVSDVLIPGWKSLLDPPLGLGSIRRSLAQGKRMLGADGWREPSPSPYVLCEEEIQ